MFFYDVFKTSLSWVGILLSAHGIIKSAMGTGPEQVLERLGSQINKAIYNPVKLTKVRGCLEAFSNGDFYALDGITLDLEYAPPFYCRAWKVCRKIPPGETRSYAWLAQAAGSPRAFRAAGHAMKKNPLPPIVPCHRVVGSDGNLRGYSSGIEIKARLLKHEQRSINRAQSNFRVF